MALVAPNGPFMYSAFSESEGGPFGFEQAYRSVSRVYEHFGAEDNQWLNLRDGEHPTTAEDIEIFVDSLDSVFGQYQHYGRPEALQLTTPLEFNRFSGRIQEKVFDWLYGLH
jgi:hypothetical protein